MENNESVECLSPVEYDGFVYLMDKEIFYNAEGGNIKKRTRILLNGEENSFNEMIIELIDDDDIYFVYRFQINSNDFEEFKRSQELKIDFLNFPKKLDELLYLSMQDSKGVYIKIYLEDNQIVLSFYQKLKLRDVVLFSLHLQPADQETVNSLIKYRFEKLQNLLFSQQRQYEDILKSINEKNPSLSKKIRSAVEKRVDQYFNPN